MLHYQTCDKCDLNQIKNISPIEYKMTFLLIIVIARCILKSKAHNYKSWYKS